MYVARAFTHYVHYDFVQFSSVQLSSVQLRWDELRGIFLTHAFLFSCEWLFSPLFLIRALFFLSCPFYLLGLSSFSHLYSAFVLGIFMRFKFKFNHIPAWRSTAITCSQKTELIQANTLEQQNQLHKIYNWIQRIMLICRAYQPKPYNEQMNGDVNKMLKLYFSGN